MPFAATGGLGDVLGSLPSAIIEASGGETDVRVVMPLYRSVSESWRSQMKKEFEKYAAEEPDQVSSIVAEREELVTIEEVVAEMEAYYDQPAQEFKEAVVFAEIEAVEEEPTAEIAVEAIEELIQTPETDVDCEEAVEEANTTTAAIVVSGRRSKKRRS